MTGNTSTSFTEAAIEEGTMLGLTTDQRHRVFSEPIRRAVLAVLADASTPTSLEALAPAVESESNVDPADVDACLAALHHRHLPILDEVGLVDYEPTTNTIQSCHGSVGGSVD